MSDSHVVHRFYCIEKYSKRKGLHSGIKCFRIIFIFNFSSKKHWAREMPQGVKALATKSDDPHGGKRDSAPASSPSNFHMCALARAYVTCTHNLNK